jgi:amino acid transporter
MAESKVELRRGVLRVPDVLFQGITHIGPAVGVIFTLPFIVSYAGAASPIAFLIATLIMAIIANTVAEFSKYMPSAGGYYSFVARGLGPRYGYMAAWCYFAYDPLGPPAVLGFGGFLAEAVFKSGTGVTVPWWVFALAGTAIVWFLTYRGVAISTRAAVALGFAELLIMIALAVTFLVVHPASHYSAAAPFNITLSPKGIFPGIAYAVLFSLLALSGFESAAPLAQETRNPKRSLPIAIMGSLVLVGVYYIFSTYAAVIGWGPGHMASFATNANPYYVLARHVWGLGWIVVFIAIVNSVLAIGIASTNAVTRVGYIMGSGGILPTGLARLHPRYNTPTRAINVQMIICAALILLIGLTLGISVIYGFLGAIITIVIILMYGLANASLTLFMYREHRESFNLWRHGIIPNFGTVVLLPVLWVTFVPVPAFPLNIVPYAVIGFLLIGFATMFRKSASSPETYAEIQRKEDAMFSADMTTAAPGGATHSADGN